MNEALINEITVLKDNLKVLITLFEEAKKINKEINEQNKTLVQKIEEQENDLNNLKQKYETLKLAKTIAASSSDTHEAKLKVSKILREIDKCIALLNK